MEPHLHWTFRHDHILFSGLVLRSFTDFLIAVPCLIGICLFERFLTFRLEQSPAPRYFIKARWGRHVRWSILYWVVNLLRLCYMLAAMTLQIGIIIVLVTSLTLGQLLIECYKSKDDPDPVSGPREDAESLTALIQRSHPLHATTESIRPRPKSRPQDIPVYPLRSNMARTDAVASQLSIDRDTEDAQHTEENLAWGAKESTLGTKGQER